MSAGQTNRIALVTDANASENCGDDSGSGVESVILDQLHVAIEFAKLTRRVAELERDNIENRKTINRILVRFATEGRPIPPEAA